MELLREWFFWGESDLFFVGIAMILMAALLPWRSNKTNYIVIGICAALYVLCELAVSFWHGSWLVLFILLFVGGTALSAAIGRIIRCVFGKLRKK